MGSVARRLLLVPLALHAGAAYAEFHPREGHGYRYITRQTRVDGATARAFTTERHVVFQRSATGFLAALTLDRIEQDAARDVAAMFQAALGALSGQTLRFVLDANGQIVAIENQAAVWQIIAEAMERMAGSAGGARTSQAQALAAPLRAMPEARQRAMLASMLAPILGGDDAARTLGTRRVTLPVVSPLGSVVTLVGEERASRGEGGVLVIETFAAGPIDPLVAPRQLGNPLNRKPVMARVTRVRRIDSRSGLVLESRDESETVIGIGDTAARRTTVTQMTLVS